MAVVNAYSDQIVTVDRSSPNAKVENDVWSGKLRFAYFTVTQVGAGDATSIQYLAKLPAGRVRIIRDTSRLATSAFGASRTLDVGLSAYTDKSGTTVAAAPTDLASALNVAAAATNNMAAAAGADPTISIESRSGVTVQSVVAG